MTRSSSKSSLYLGLAVIVVVGAFLIYRFVWSKPADDNLVGLEPAGLITNQVGGDDDFLQLLSSLQTIDLSDAARVMPLLAALTDFSTELEPQTPGRDNPFAPIGADRPAPVETTPDDSSLPPDLP